MCLSEGGMWECNGGWCDLRLCAIWSCKAKRLNTARHWVICFLITLHLTWISFVPLKEHEGTYKPWPFLSLCVAPSLSSFRPHQTPLCVPSWALKLGGGGGLVSNSRVGWEAGDVGLYGSSLWAVSRGRLQIPGVVQTLPFRIKETWKRCLMFKGFTLLSTATWAQATGGKVRLLSLCGQMWSKWILPQRDDLLTLICQVITLLSLKLVNDNYIALL